MMIRSAEKAQHCTQSKYSLSFPRMITLLPSTTMFNDISAVCKYPRIFEYIYTHKWPYQFWKGAHERVDRRAVKMSNNNFPSSSDKNHRYPVFLPLPEKPSKTHSSRFSSYSFHESILNRTLSNDNNGGKARKNTPPASSRDHEKGDSSDNQKEKYNKVNVADLLFDRGGNGTNVCTINNCNRKFISKESLLAHQRKAHAPPTAHVCPYCRSSFSTIPNLNKHVSESAFLFFFMNRLQQNFKEIDLFLYVGSNCSRKIETIFMWPVSFIFCF